MNAKLLFLLGAGLTLYLFLTKKASAEPAPGAAKKLPPGGRMSATVVPTYTFASTGPSAVTGHDVIPIGQASDPTLAQMDESIIYAQKQLYDLAGPIGKQLPAGQVATTQRMLRAQLVDLVYRRRLYADQLTKAA